MSPVPRVLVVEDDAPLAATLERVLVAEGHEVEVAGDGAEALRRAKFCKSAACRLLGINIQRLNRRMRRLGISKPRQ